MQWGAVASKRLARCPSENFWGKWDGMIRKEYEHGMSDHVLQKSRRALCSLDIGLLRFLFYVPPIGFSQSISNTAPCSVCLFVPPQRRFSSVVVARSLLRPTVLISNPLVWVKLWNSSVPSAPGLKVPVGLGFSPTILTALPIRFPPLCLLGIFLDSNI